MIIHCNKNITKQLNSYSYVITITLQGLLQHIKRIPRVQIWVNVSRSRISTTCKKKKKKKKTTQSEQKTPHKGGQTIPIGGERNLNFFELPKRKHLKGGGEPFEKIKEREERKQKKEKRVGGHGNHGCYRTLGGKLFCFFLLGKDESNER